MRKIHILGIALCAAFAFSAIAAASAFAVSEWLFNGNVISTELETDTEGTLTLLVLSGATLVNEIDCSGLFMGGVGPGAVNLVLDLFSLPPNNVVIEELPGTALTCETLTNPTGMACGVALETLIWADELRLGAEPLTWETLIELMVTGPEFLDHFHHVAFELLCLTNAGVNTEALCSGETSGKLENVAAGVLIEFSDVAPVESELLTCTNGTTVGLDTDLTIKHSGPGTLSVS